MALEINWLYHKYIYIVHSISIQNVRWHESRLLTNIYIYIYIYIVHCIIIDHHSIVRGSNHKMQTTWKVETPAFAVPFPSFWPSPGYNPSQVWSPLATTYSWCRSGQWRRTANDSSSGQPPWCWSKRIPPPQSQQFLLTYFDYKTLLVCKLNQQYIPPQCFLPRPSSCIFQSPWREIH